jgi:hypothetical protein
MRSDILGMLRRAREVKGGKARGLWVSRSRRQGEGSVLAPLPGVAGEQKEHEDSEQEPRCPPHESTPSIVHEQPVKTRIRRRDLES